MRLRYVFFVVLFSFLLSSCGSQNNSTTTTSGANNAPTTPPPPPQPPPQLATWTNQFNGVPFTMVGTDPSIPGAGTTSVAVEIIPVVFNFSLVGVALNPNNPACGDVVSQVSRVQNSPLFTSITWSDGPTVIGNTQFPDAFQRANFWQLVGSVSPNYHVLLQPVSVQPTVTVEVPVTIGAVLQPNPFCAASGFAEIPINFMDSIVTQVVQSQHIAANTLPIFLTYDVSFSLPSGGFYLGYHTRQGNQTYVVASYTDPSFSLINNVLASDVTVLSHELGEWMDNPLGVNRVPAWGSFGIQQSCGSDLEVGDPLTGSPLIPVAMPGFTYHIQELAYFSWFARNVPSLALNGRYSTRSTFLAPAPPCL